MGWKRGELTRIIRGEHGGTNFTAFENIGRRHNGSKPKKPEQDDDQQKNCRAMDAKPG